MRSNGSIHPFSAFICCTTLWADCWSAQNPGCAIRSSSSLSAFRFTSTSKVPPKLSQTFGFFPKNLPALGVSHRVLHDVTTTRAVR
jgi:hypothetical protein